jgi:hypothetical protein
MVNHLDNLHEKLIQASKGYKSWHEGDEYHVKNWTLFGVAILVIVFLGYNTLYNSGKLVFGSNGLQTIALSLGSNTEASSAINFSASAQFSGIQGKDGWYYLNSNGSQMTFDSSANYWRGNERYLLLWANGGHPGKSQDSLRRWISPVSGQATISGRVFDTDRGGGDGVKVSIKQNGKVLWQGSVANGDATGLSYNLSLPLNVDDQIDFIINKASNNYWDSTSFDPTISVMLRPPSSDYSVGAFYMPAWKLGTHRGWPSLENYPNRKPLLGFYDEGSPEVMDWEIKWALEHGISFFVFDWFRSNVGQPITMENIYLGHALHDGFFKSKFQDQFKFSIMLTSHDPTLKIVSSKQDLEDTLMPFLIKNYFSRPNYLKINNKPILYVFSWQDLMKEVGGTEQDLKTALDIMRQKSKDAGFDDLIIVGQNRVNFSGTSAARSYAINVLNRIGFDNVAAYNWFVPLNLLRPSVQEAIDVQIDSLSFWKDENIIPFIPTASMGWNSFPWDHDPNKPQWKIPPSSYKDLLKRIKTIMDDMPESDIGHRMILLGAWNEYGEGHYIAPTSEYGFGYLQAAREVFTNADNTPDYRLPEEVGLGPYDFMYQNHKVYMNTKRLSVHYSFEGNADNMVEDDNNGLINGPTLTQGHIGQAYEFDGQNDYISIANNSKLDGMNSVSFGGWVYVNSVSNDVIPFGKSSGYRAVLTSKGGGHCVVATENNPWYGEGTLAIWAAGMIQAQQWHHVLCVYDGARVRAYIDGVQVAVSSSDISGPIRMNPEMFTIGKKAGMSGWFNGIIDEIKIWNYALSKEEIKNLVVE